jgi:hypothetical protein
MIPKYQSTAWWIGYSMKIAISGTKAGLNIYTLNFLAHLAQRAGIEVVGEDQAESRRRRAAHIPWVNE